MTAFTTLPFLTVPSGEASLTAAVTTSPRPAFLPRPPPRGRITCNLRAPELSATSSIVLICTDIVLLLAIYCGDTAGAHTPGLNLINAKATWLRQRQQQQTSLPPGRARSGERSP